MSIPVEKKRHTIAEYLASEEAAEERHEFHDGEILAMSGATYRHAKVAGNTYHALRNRLKGHRCEPLNSDLRISIPDRVSYMYPDVSIVCGPPEFDSADRKQRTITNPKVIIEVLSESTERYDRGRKFDFYRQNLSIDEYVLISQDEPSAETFLRQAEGSWLMHPCKGMETQLVLRSIGLTIPLSEIFEGISFDAPADSAS